MHEWNVAILNSVFIYFFKFADSFGQVIKSVCVGVCVCVCLSVCEHSHGRIS